MRRVLCAAPRLRFPQADRRARALEPRAPGLRRHQALGDRDRQDAAVVGDAADHDRLEQMMGLGIHLHREARRRGDAPAAERVAHLVDIGGAGGFDRGGPQLKADPGRFHRIVGHRVGLAGEAAPLGDERAVLRRVEGVQIIPRHEMAGDIRVLERGKLGLVDRQRHDRNLRRDDFLVRQFAEEMHVGVAGNRRHDRGAAAAGEAADVLDHRAPIGLAERGIAFAAIRKCLCSTDSP